MKWYKNLKNAAPQSSNFNFIQKCINTDWLARTINTCYMMCLQSNLFNTDTKGTEPSVFFTEVSVLQR